jgi:hypothetical protein
MKRNYLKYTVIAFVIVSLSCSKGFDLINLDPNGTAAENFDAGAFLSTSQLQYASASGGAYGPLTFEAGWAQILANASGNGSYWATGDKYLLSANTTTYTTQPWNSYYSSAGYAMQLLASNIKTGDSNNIKGAALIMKVLNMQSVTDIWGDCPYSEAFAGLSATIVQPVYDKQQDVYSAMLADLNDAVNRMNASSTGPTYDASTFAGNAGKWKRFGYSLMLRVAMRLTKIDPALAQQWAEKAAAGGTLQAGEDLWFMRDVLNYQNPDVAYYFATPGEYYLVRWSQPLIDWLKNSNDPRLGVISEVPPAGYAANVDLKALGDPTAANQVGMPSGYDQTPAGAHYIGNAPGYPGSTGSGGDIAIIGKYSRPTFSVYGNYDLPVIAMTYAESELLLAEAAVRGWNVGGTAATHYRNGVSGAAMSVNGLKEGLVTQAAADAFAAASPLDVSSTDNSLKMINTQYWATNGLLWNWIEAWSNYKRSGYPALTPVNYPSNFSNGQIPRRQIYPPSENTYNPKNYKIASDNMGGDNWTSRVWWDK